MFRVILSLSLFAAGYCSICCVPKLWEGTQSSIEGIYQDVETVTHLLGESVNISYDAVNQRIAATHYIDFDTGSYKNFVTYVLDYKNRVQYTFNNTMCRRTTLGPWTESCIPDDAKTTGSTYLGAGPGQLNETHYTFQRAGLDVGVSVTSALCVPLSSSVSGRYGLKGSGGYIWQGLSYTGITAGIKDASVFTPPSYCANSKLYNYNVAMPQTRKIGVFNF